MIIVRTPLRISLAGGGTDMAAFYKHHPGAVVSFTIDKYLYVSVNPKFDGRTRVSYSVTEEVEHPSLLKHDLAREALDYFGESGVEISSVSDIPGEGTGLGSSSAYITGLMKALALYTDSDITPTPSAFAELGYYVERTMCGHPVGKQDHYAAAHGGLKFYEFKADDTVGMESLMDANVVKGLEGILMLFYTGKARQANDILRSQEENLRRDSRVGLQLRNLATDLRDELRRGNYQSVGYILDRA